MYYVYILQSLKNEAPSSLRSGYLLRSLSREQNPAEAEISSHSFTGLRQWFSAKADKIRGALFNAYNELGYGHKEQVYQKALAKELELKNISYIQEKGLSVKYKGQIVGNYRPDFLIENKVILELKAVEFVPKSFETQLIHYLKTTNYNLGILANFGSSKLLIKRFVWGKNL